MTSDHFAEEMWLINHDIGNLTSKRQSSVVGSVTSRIAMTNRRVDLVFDERVIDGRQEYLIRWYINKLFFFLRHLILFLSSSHLIFKGMTKKKKTWEAAGNVHVLGCDRLEQFLADKVKINIDIQLVINIKLIAEEEVSQDTLFSQDVLLRSRSTTNC